MACCIGCTSGKPKNCRASKGVQSISIFTCMFKPYARLPMTLEPSSCWRLRVFGFSSRVTIAQNGWRLESSRRVFRNLRNRRNVKFAFF
jgi:hypothetical protein